MAVKQSSIMQSPDHAICDWFSLKESSAAKWLQIINSWQPTIWKYYYLHSSCIFANTCNHRSANLLVRTEKKTIMITRETIWTPTTKEPKKKPCTGQQFCTQSESVSTLGLFAKIAILRQFYCHYCFVCKGDIVNVLIEEEKYV